MTDAVKASGPDAFSTAIGVVELGLAACTAYGRADLAGRLGTARRRLTDPAVRVVVVGEFKKGKSALVNALVGAQVCPVDDDVATAVPTYLGYGPQPTAELLFAGDPPRSEPVAVEQIRAHVLERHEPTGSAGSAGATGRAGSDDDRVIGVNVRLPRKILGGGLVIVDTPGVGGLGSAHAAASLAALSLADAVIFVTDASQELTHSELEFLRRARRICPTMACVITKNDFYPAARKIRSLNEEHLRAEPDLPLMTVSSTLRARAVATSDRELNAESGFAELIRFVTDQVGGRAAERIAGEAAAEVIAVCDQLQGTFEAERAALTDPVRARQVTDELNATRDRVNALKSAAAKWSQTLTDGIADLTSDVDHDLRSRIRQVLAEADKTIEDIDPADSWSEMETWLRARLAHDLLANHTLLLTRTELLSETVSDHFRQDSSRLSHRLDVRDPAALVTDKPVEHQIELEKMRLRKQAAVALKGAYGGALISTMLASFAGVVLGPIGIGVGLVMGHRSLRAEKKRQQKERQSQAKNAIRRYCDEVSFVAGKDSRDTLRRVHRRLRDHYSELAEQLNRSTGTALAAATEAAKRTQAQREQRLRDIDAELTRLRQVRQRATALTGQAEAAVAG